MTDRQILISILVIAAVTAILRFSPFLIFGVRRKTPAFIEYLGKVLPFAIMGMLCVYCLKDVSISSPLEWVPALCGVVITAAVQVWKHNSIYSILAGTVLYMVLIRIPF